MSPRLFLLFAVVVWGWTFVASKICLRYMAPVELLGLRLLIAVPVLAGILLARRIPFVNPLRSRALMLAGAIIGVHFFVQISGLRYTSATNTGWIIGVTPLVMALLAALLLKERLRRDLIVGIVVATAGVLVLVSRGHPGRLDWLKSVGDWLILASAHTWALYTIAVRDAARAADPLAVTCAVLTPPALVTVAIMAFISDWQRLARLPLEAYLALAFLGVIGMALAQWAWQVGVARLGASRAGVFLYLEPLATTGLAVPYLKEPFGLSTVGGGALVLLGVWWAQRKRIRSLQKPVPNEGGTA